MAVPQRRQCGHNPDDVPLPCGNWSGCSVCEGTSRRVHGWIFRPGEESRGRLFAEPKTVSSGLVSDGDRSASVITLRGSVELPEQSLPPFPQSPIDQHVFLVVFSERKDVKTKNAILHAARMQSCFPLSRGYELVHRAKLGRLHPPDDRPLVERLSFVHDFGAPPFENREQGGKPRLCRRSALSRCPP
jgi:hypothetical protein